MLKEAHDVPSAFEGHQLLQPWWSRTGSGSMFHRKGCTAEFSIHGSYFLDARTVTPNEELITQLCPFPSSVLAPSKARSP